MLVRNGLQNGEHYNSDNMFVPLSFFAQKDLLQLSKTFLLKKSYFIVTPTNPPHYLVHIHFALILLGSVESKCNLLP